MDRRTDSSIDKQTRKHLYAHAFAGAQSHKHQNKHWSPHVRNCTLNNRTDAAQHNSHNINIKQRSIKIQTGKHANKHS